MKSLVFSILTIFCFSACTDGESKKKDLSQLSSIEFTIPEIPDSISSKDKKEAFLATHFWDNYNFKDTSASYKDRISEQAYVDFLNVLVKTDTATATEAINIFTSCAAVEPLTSDYFMSLTEKYLYNPHSPMYAEELYIRFLRSYINDKNVDDDKKIRPSMHLKAAIKNRFGSIATDFTYTTSDGKKDRMSAIKSPLTLIYFNNPLCEECQNTLAQMKQTPILEQLIKDKKLVILSMYVDDDPDMWREHTSEYPSSWIIAMDEGGKIDGEELYSLRLIPSLYLLDGDKRVILKDAQWNAVNEFFKQK